MKEIVEKIDRYIEIYKTPPTGREVQGTVELLEECKSIIAKESSRWIPIEEGLPPLGIPLIVSVYDTFKITNELRYPVIYRKSLFREGYNFYVYGAEENILLPEYTVVKAWMEFPGTYKEDL